MPRFSAKLLEHFHSPCNAGEMAEPSAVGIASRGGRAPRATLFVALEGSLVTRVTFLAFGCGVTIACCSALTELAGGCTVDETSHLNRGALLTFTPEVIAKIGGFKIMPGRWGYTHVNWTRRIIKSRLAPFSADVTNSNKFVRLSKFGTRSSVSVEEKHLAERANWRPAQDFSELYCKLEE